MLDANSREIIHMLTQSGYSAYAVGGCVRDALMGSQADDIDITTSATPEEMISVFEKNGIKHVPTGIKHGTITAIIDHSPYEITAFRTDGKYNDSRHPESVSFVRDISTDLARRDFTMNAIAYNSSEGYVDAFGGIEDIKNHIIRCVGDADKRFKEDALRILRALRFASVLGFDIEESTNKAIFANKELLLNIANERIFTELKKLLLGKNVESVLLEYRYVLAVVIPELKDSFDYPQNSKWHIYDVYTHIIKSVALSPEKLNIRLALLLHDIGKPFTRTTDEQGQDHFKGHPAVSTRLADDVLARLRVSRELHNQVLSLVENHDRHILTKPESIKKWLRLLGEELTLDFIDVKIADMLTHNLSLAGDEVDYLREVRAMTEKIISSGEPYRICDLAINGNDLVALGYRGNEISAQLNMLAEHISAHPEDNITERLIEISKASGTA